MNDFDGCYVQLMCDPDADRDDLFKPGQFELLDERYRERFEQAYGDSLKPVEKDWASSPDFSGDILPF